MAHQLNQTSTCQDLNYQEKSIIITDIEQGKKVTNELEFGTRASFLKFLELKRRLHGAMTEATLLTFTRLKDKMSLEYYT